MIKYILLSLIILIYGCKSKSDIKESKEYYKSGELKSVTHLINNKKNGSEIFYYKNGNIKSFKNYFHDTLNNEVLLFDSIGNLKEKYRLKMGVANGVSYNYDSSGVVTRYRMWINGKEQGYGEDKYAFNGSTMILYWFTDDSIMNTRYFDPTGHLYKEEGIHPTIDDLKRYDSLVLEYEPVGKLKPSLQIIK